MFAQAELAILFDFRWGRVADPKGKRTTWLVRPLWHQARMCRFRTGAGFIHYTLHFPPLCHSFEVLV